nr:hypothetical protein [Accumulibacter sp.]
MSTSRWGPTSRTLSCWATPTSKAPATPSPTSSPATAGANTLAGGDGNDALDGGAGADALAGGAGDDAYWVDDAGDKATEGAGAGTDTVYSGVSWILGDNVENLVLGGWYVNIDGKGNALANRLTGNDWSNVLDGQGGADALAGLGATTPTWSTTPGTRCPRRRTAARTR